jgi:hypothetical protein
LFALLAGADIPSLPDIPSTPAASAGLDLAVAHACEPVFLYVVEGTFTLEFDGRDPIARKPAEALLQQST